MDWLAAFFALFFLNVVALAMAAYVDHRARRRIRDLLVPAGFGPGVQEGPPDAAVPAEDVPGVSS